MTASAGLFGAYAVALYVGHHVGDYWVQTDTQARRKGDAGWIGRLECMAHVLTYLATQCFVVGAAAAVLDFPVVSWWRIAAFLAVSGVTHYAADRREHGLMFWLARRLPSARGLLTLGKPRPGTVYVETSDHLAPRRVTIDQPTLGPRAWALDQSWHLFFGVFVSALILAS